MSNITFKKISSIVICISLLMASLSYADTVVIGQAPTSSVANKTVSGQATTTYLTNTYTGPGTVPNSATNYGTTPIQGLSYDQSTGQMNAIVDSNGVADSSPTVQTITSPGAHNAELASFTSSVISNSAGAMGTSGQSTSDSGPTTYEIDAPVAGGESSRTSSKVVINGVEVDLSGPGSTTTTKTTTNSSSATGASIPSYSSQTTQTQTMVTVNNNVNNTGAITYQCNDNIQAVKPSISAEGALMVNATTRQIYFSKGGFTKFHPAGITTLVTAALLMQSKGLDDVLTVSGTAVSGIESGAMTAGLKPGDTIKVRDCLGGLFVKSCADIANVVAENVAGSIPNFVNLMNQTVKNWGCLDTNFTNPTGLNSDAQVTTTYDAAIMMDKVTDNPNLKIMLAQYAYVLPATAYRGAKSLKSTNELLIPGKKTYYAGATSRLGYTSKAKYTITSAIDYNGCKLIAVVLKTKSSQFTDSVKLLNYGKVASIEAAAKGNVATTNVNAAVATTTGGAAYANAITATVVNGVPSYTTTGTTTATVTVNASTQNLPTSGTVTTQVTSTSADSQGTWAQDSTGWYFVKSDGSRAVNEWIKQNGKMYCVDSTGYMIKGWREMSNGKMYYFDQTTGEFKSNTWINLDTGAYYLQSDGSLARAENGTKNIVTTVGTYTIDQTGKAIAKVA